MRKRLFVMIAALGALCGCAHHYVITMQNQVKITTSSKPHLEHGHWVFKDAKGHLESIPEGRVYEIAPASMDREETAAFKPKK